MMFRTVCLTVVLVALCSGLALAEEQTAATVGIVPTGLPVIIPVTF